MGRRIVVEVSGYTRAAEGAAGYGVAIVDEATGELMAEAAEGIGAATMAVAVYRGVCTGLLTATSTDTAAALEVRTDCRSVVEELTRRADTGDPSVQALRDEVMHAAASFGPGGVVFSWVPRDRNERAVEMARLACDSNDWERPWVRTATVEVPQAEPESQPPAEPLQALVPPMPSTTLLLVRTAETLMSRERRFAGDQDGDLTDDGVAQARALASQLFIRGDVDVIACSDLRPATAMAQILAEVLGLAVVTVPDLREPGYGEWEGLTFTEVQAAWPDEVFQWTADPHTPPPGGESLAAAQARIEAAVDTLVERFPHRTIAVVTHVTPIKMVVRRALEAASVALHRMHLDAASLTEIDVHSEGAVVRSLNDTRHLDPAAGTSPQTG
ncbi:histidine phosphatase family protein [Actinomadura opuntiae]|uniref:histidine phosphatase family protein n=1 Tax=Actinomadura sp. OS1-43 TaxID=604315 RepID=UPI00255B09F5|nr:histidine phosphatase family protein [Actinomadura sp. OS1-43]MDL4815406.1 histidine phosphatase family protein [Actinomadura sp. OS1-43]